MDAWRKSSRNTWRTATSEPNAGVSAPCSVPYGGPLPDQVHDAGVRKGRLGEIEPGSDGPPHGILDDLAGVDEVRGLEVESHYTFVDLPVDHRGALSKEQGGSPVVTPALHREGEGRSFKPRV